MTPARAAQPLIDACKDATVVTLPGTGHSLMAENPDGVREALRRFASRVFGRAAPDACHLPRLSLRSTGILTGFIC